MDMVLYRPAVHEKPSGEKPTSYKHGRKAVFWLVVAAIALVCEPLSDPISRQLLNAEAKQHADATGEINQPNSALVEAIVGLEDEGKGTEHEVDQGIDKSGVKTQDEAHG